VSLAAKPCNAASQRWVGVTPAVAATLAPLRAVGFSVTM
jgi:hypothetical protein